MGVSTPDVGVPRCAALVRRTNRTPERLAPAYALREQAIGEHLPPVPAGEQAGFW